MVVLVYNWFRIWQRVKRVGYPLQKIPKIYRFLSTVGKRLKLGIRFVSSVCVSWFLLVYVFYEWLRFKYSFGAEKFVGLFRLYLKVKMGTNWFWFNTNHYLCVGTIFNYFADFASRVVENKSPKNLVEPLAIWTTLLNRLFYHTRVDFDRKWLGRVFLLRDALEMWSFPFKGRGDDANLDTTFVGVSLYSEHVCISGVLTYKYLCHGLVVRCAWLVAWNIVYLAPLIRVECCLTFIEQGYVYVHALTRYDNGGVWVMNWTQATLEFDPLAGSEHPRKYPCYLERFETCYEWWIDWTPKRWIVSALKHVSGIGNFTAAQSNIYCDATEHVFTNLKFLTINCAAFLPIMRRSNAQN